jgi:hypothetical protein
MSIPRPLAIFSHVPDPFLPPLSPPADRGLIDFSDTIAQLRQTDPFLLLLCPSPGIHVPTVPMNVNTPVAALMLYIETVLER